MYACVEGKNGSAPLGARWRDEYRKAFFKELPATPGLCTGRHDLKDRDALEVAMLSYEDEEEEGEYMNSVDQGAGDQAGAGGRMEGGGRT